jgi:hypothetical protein
VKDARPYPEEVDARRPHADQCGATDEDYPMRPCTRERGHDRYHVHAANEVTLLMWWDRTARRKAR